MLLALAGYANPDGTSIRPGRPNLMRATKFDRDTIREAIKFWLRHESGVLIEREKGDGRGHASVFEMVMPTEENKGGDDDSKGADEPPHSTQEGADTPHHSGKGGDKGADSNPERGGERGGLSAHTELPFKATELPKQGAAEIAALDKGGNIALPAWVPIPPWSEFLKARKQQKKPLTAYQQELTIQKLDQLRKSGNDPAAVLNQSILNNWADLWPLKRNGNQTENERLGLSRFPGAHPTVADHHARMIKNLEVLGAESLDGSLGLPPGTFQALKLKLLSRGTTFADDPEVLGLVDAIVKQMESNTRSRLGLVEPR